MTRITWLAAAVLLAALSSGCVTRRYVITSDPPGAVVYRDGQPIGATPVEEPFVYHGKYRFRLVKDGYQPLDVEPVLEEPWYQWPGIDFITENLICYTFRDVQCLHFQLQPMETVRPDDIRARAETLRSRGQAIQTPPGTEPPPKIRPPHLPPPGPELPPGALPVPVPAPGLPAPTPSFPPPTPGGGVTTPLAPSAAPSASPSISPSVPPSASPSPVPSSTSRHPGFPPARPSAGPTPAGP